MTGMRTLYGAARTPACATCGAAIPGDGPYAYCSAQCRKASALIMPPDIYDDWGAAYLPYDDEPARAAGVSLGEAIGAVVTEAKRRKREHRQAYRQKRVRESAPWLTNAEANRALRRRSSASTSTGSRPVVLLVGWWW